MIQSKKPESPEQWASVFQNYPYDFFIGVIEESIINNFHDDEEDKEQLTPLHLLIKYNKNKGKAEMMQKMIELNADINTPTSINKTAVDLAYEYKNDNFLCEIIWGKIDNNNRDLKYQHSKILEQLNSETKKKKKYIKEIESFKGRIVKMEKEIKVKSDLIENLKEKNKKKLERSINQQQSTLKNTVEENENLKKQIQRVNKKIEKYIEEKSKIEEHIKKYVQLIKDEKRKVIQLNEKIKKINKK
ncbi:ankyrin repeat-containing protein [Anaeramoeba flamelloides]|uniref:Ankyrin repeat-containing protein n=1 Tax=Anaeramoeba flamelloides TaxID=1746091 RepID=A0AAV7ZTT6_9EUKA|nr:ankyrin repeat-containing protein [Anaeramoeba flamelloides]